MVTINIQKKDLYLVAAIFVFIVGVGFVIATNSGSSSINGHTADEVYMPGALCGMTSWTQNGANSIGAYCMGTYDPFVSCPTGFTRTWTNFGGGIYRIYTCWKN